ncbi:MAG: hypothetical protein ACFE0Q_00010 [Anaerolineae bacterium]
MRAMKKYGIPLNNFAGNILNCILIAKCGVLDYLLLDARSVLTWDDWRSVENKYGAVILRADLRRAINRVLIKKLPLTTLATILTSAL